LAAEKGQREATQARSHKIRDYENLQKLAKCIPVFELIVIWQQRRLGQWRGAWAELVMGTEEATEE